MAEKIKAGFSPWPGVVASGQDESDGMALQIPGPSELVYYPHIFRPILAQRLDLWAYQKQGTGGWTYEGVLWSFRVPGKRALILNRFGAANTLDSNYTLRVNGTPDPVIHDVGEKTFTIVGGVPVGVTTTYRNFLWDVDGSLGDHPIRGSFLIDPVVVNEGALVEMYAKTSAAMGEMAAGVAGYLYATVAAGYAATPTGM